MPYKDKNKRRECNQKCCAAYRKCNPAKFLEMNRARLIRYRQLHPGKMEEYNRRYYLDHHEECKARNIANYYRRNGLKQQQALQKLSDILIGAA